MADIIGVGSPVVFSGTDMSVLDMPQSTTMTACRIFVNSWIVQIEGIATSRGRPVTAYLWMNPQEYHTFGTGVTMSSVNVSGGSVIGVLNSSSSLQSGQIFLNGDIFPMPSDYVSMSNRTAVMADGILCVGLSSKTGGKPQIWKDGTLEELDYNGYVCSVTTNKDQASQETVLD